MLLNLGHPDKLEMFPHLIVGREKQAQVTKI